MELGNLIFGHSRGTYEVPRDQWQDRFCKFLDNIGCDYYGIADDQDNPRVNSRGGVTTKMFCLYPYYWGNDEEEYNQPNFVYHPTGYRLAWYKYPLRDAYSNQILTYEEFDSMLTDCEVYYATPMVDETVDDVIVTYDEEYGCWEDSDDIPNAEDEEWND